MADNRKVKGIMLLSGGLDSILAAHILKEQRIDLTAIHFTTPFHPKPSSESKNYPKITAEKLNIKLKNVPLGNHIIDILKDPSHGYGKNMNPCIDCRIRQLKIAKNIMKDEGAVFIATGEVLGQRPMSQNMNSLKKIEREAGVEGILLRPLSAKNLKSTEVEEKGLIDRNKLLDISGRTRKRQLELAKQFKITKDQFQPAAGGCRLTNISYAEKIRDLKEHDILNMKNVLLVNQGRHFRLSQTAKLIVGRNEEENKILMDILPPEAHSIVPADIPGPFSVGIGSFGESEKKLAAGICARYTDKNSKTPIEFLWKVKNNQESRSALPLKDKIVKSYIIS